MFRPSSRAVLFLLLLFAWATATGWAAGSTPDARCFELRIYTANKGKLNDLHARFRNHTMQLFQQHGMTNIGYWTPIENPEQKLVYILAYPSKEQREEAWKAFQEDPEWVKAKTESETAGPLVAKVESKFMTATDFSPTLQPGTGGQKRIFELRTYNATKGNLERLVARSRANTEPLFQKYGISGLAYWTLLPKQPGSETTLLCLLAHSSAAAGEAAFKKLKSDPEWVKAKEESETAAGGPLTEADVASLYLQATDYSPLK